jgi:ribosomal protein L27
MATMGSDNVGAGHDETTFSLTDRDREILSMRDEDYKLQTWDDLKEIICTAP